MHALFDQRSGSGTDIRSYQTSALKTEELLPKPEMVFGSVHARKMWHFPEGQNSLQKGTVFLKAMKLL